MFTLIRDNQLNIMLILCGACGVLAFLLFHTGFMSKSRKWILILMELIALFLLWFDRLAYVYAGNPGYKGYIMVRVSNFMVFFLTSAVVFGFDLYLTDWLKNEGKMTTIPKRLTIVMAISTAGMVLAVISAFTGLYYYFDETNLYHRGRGFLIAYIIPVICPLILYTVIHQYRKVFGRLIFISMVLYIYVPIACGILQIFTYGISIVNMSMVAVSISLFIFTYLDINNTVKHAHEIEIRNMRGEQERMQRLFDQTAMALVNTIENKDEYLRGSSVRIAEYAKRITRINGKSEEDCEKVYYAALLHDVGLIGIPDSVIRGDADPMVHEIEMMRQIPVMGAKILSSITEYPYLSIGAHYCYERYNGTGYPEGLRGEEIPETARIIAVADAYVKMTSRRRHRDASPAYIARERFIRGAGEEYDPVFAKIMVKIIDMDGDVQIQESVSDVDENTELICDEYRDHVLTGIPIDENVKRIRFECTTMASDPRAFSEPSIVLFDSNDRRVHTDEKTISEYHYLEYGEIWFDDHMISTAVRKAEVTGLIRTETSGGIMDGGIRTYEIVAGRFEDHIKLSMTGPYYTKEIIIVLPDSSKSSYIGLTGEHCRIAGISVEPTGETVKPGDIPKIAQQISYTDHMESDLKNIQIDRTRSASTQGIKIRDRLRIVFHTMSLPEADLVWHCPYVVVFTSGDGTVGGPDYYEYNMIKLNGEDQGSCEFCRNRFVMKKKEEFPGWDKWKRRNKKGVECEVTVVRRGNRIFITTENMGIYIESTSVILNDPDAVYIALTGDQVALTDIRVYNE